ncbi:hypothetical protein [Streptomyces antibioticus]|uniref:hypothetical protein n=1 Tax=Streptomyces antibioticus TaxID=1890 RepID=UPI0036B09D97
MRYQNEDEVKQALEIDSWRHLSKENMVKFAAMMPDMSTELALKIVEQFPVFTDFAKDVVGVMEKTYDSTLSANKESQELFHRACQDIRDILRSELAKGGLSWDEKKFIIEQIQETGRMEFQKDSENKRFLSVNLKRALAGAGAALALAVVFVGGKVILGGNEDDPGDEPQA